MAPARIISGDGPGAMPWHISWLLSIALARREAAKLTRVAGSGVNWHIGVIGVLVGLKHAAGGNHLNPSCRARHFQLGAASVALGFAGNGRHGTRLARQRH